MSQDTINRITQHIHIINIQRRDTSHSRLLKTLVESFLPPTPILQETDGQVVAGEDRVYQGAG